MSELKLCPFCDGTYETIKNHPDTCYIKLLNDNFGAFCNQSGYKQHTQSEMLNAWNTRYNLTCKQTDTYENIFECSECGTLDTDGIPNYCPGCGAKVMRNE